MPDNQQNTTPTDGPWRVCPVDWRSVEDEQGYTVADVRKREHGDLIALAPEMAEAILLWTSHKTRHLAEATLFDLSYKLRALTADQEPTR